MFIQYQTSVHVPGPREVAEEDCVTEIQGDIMTFVEDSDDTLKIGEILVDYLDIQRAKLEGISVWSLFDYASDMGALSYDKVWDKDLNTYHSEITEAMLGENALLVEAVYIEPEYRGHLLALAAVDLTIQHFGHDCCVAILHPYPLIQQVPPELSAAEIEAAVASLSVHFARMGFRPVPNSSLMALDLNRVRPTLAEIGWKGAPD